MTDFNSEAWANVMYSQAVPKIAKTRRIRTPDGGSLTEKLRRIVSSHPGISLGEICNALKNELRSSITGSLRVHVERGTLKYVKNENEKRFYFSSEVSTVGFVPPRSTKKKIKPASQECIDAVVKALKQKEWCNTHEASKYIPMKKCKDAKCMFARALTVLRYAEYLGLITHKRAFNSRGGLSWNLVK